MKPYYWFLILSLTCFSCSDLKKGEQLKQIQNFQMRLDSIKNLWNPTELTTIDSLSTLCLLKIDSIGKVYNDQHIDETLAKKLDEYKQCSQELLDLKQMHAFFPKLLKEKEQSLKKLKEDISKGKGRRDKYGEFIDFEGNELATILKQFELYKKIKKSSVINYASSKKALNLFLDSLKMVHNTQNNVKV